MYSTNVVALECYPEFAGENNVVFNIAWKMVGTDGTYQAEYRGKTAVPYSDGEFTPYSELTEQKVMAWVDRYTPAGDMLAARAFIKNNIAAQTQPSPATPPLPWNA